MRQATGTTPQASTPRPPNVQATAAPPGVPAPTTVQDIFALRIRRDELSSQLISANNRRNSTANQYRNAPPGPDRSGLEDRLAVLDKRIAQIETDIAETGRQLTTAPAQLLSTAGNPSNRGGPSPGQMTAMGIVGTVVVLGPLAIAFALRLIRRGARGIPLHSTSPETAKQLERMEQGIEVIALEVERISEGQRFVAQLMSDGAHRGSAERARLPESAPRGS